MAHLPLSRAAATFTGGVPPGYLAAAPTNPMGHMTTAHGASDPAVPTGTPAGPAGAPTVTAADVPIFCHRRGCITPRCSATSAPAGARDAIALDAPRPERCISPPFSREAAARAHTVAGSDAGTVVIGTRVCGGLRRVSRSFALRGYPRGLRRLRTFARTRAPGFIDGSARPPIAISRGSGSLDGSPIAISRGSPLEVCLTRGQRREQLRAHGRYLRRWR